MVVPQNVTHAYRIMGKIERNIAGGEGSTGIYGSITATGMQKIIDAMKAYGLSATSVFVDVGAGLARPMIHAHVDPGVMKTVGYEIDPIKCLKAHTMITRVRESGVIPPTAETTLICSNVASESKLPHGTTHVYAFWQGFSENDRRGLGNLFRKCSTARCIVVVQNVRDGFAAHPELAMEWMGFGPLRFAKKMSVAASGSGGQFTAFVFVKRKRQRKLTF